VALEYKINKSKSYAKPEELALWQLQLDDIKQNLQNLQKLQHLALQNQDHLDDSPQQNKSKLRDPKVPSVLQRQLKEMLLKKQQFQNQEQSTDQTVMDNTMDRSKVNASLFAMKSLALKNKTSNYQPQSWFMQIKNTDKDIVKQLRLLPKLNQSIANHSEIEINDALKQKKHMIDQLDQLTYKKSALHLARTST